VTWGWVPITRPVTKEGKSIITEILAEAGRITGLGPEVGGNITFGLQSAYAKQAGQKPMRFVASASQLTDLGDHDLVIVRFSRTDHRTMAGPLPVASLSLA
jgi:hypothetical protein